MTDSEETVAEKFATVHQHLDYVDRTLDSLSREIQAEVNDIVDTTDVTVEYDIDSGSFQARLPVEEIAARINQRLDPPFFVRVDGTTVVVEDIRRAVDLDVVDLDEHRGDRERARATKDVISGLEDSYDDGAPENEVITLLEYSGLSRSNAEHEIERLKQKGEIYEPSMDRLRTT
ncbi:hypothetical protein [Saliphagus infecundisoli]|uniref:MCM C-terminal domain-containing protein n=1 Tax=Saliphagus infecundisoli TaxID=1849069 RepID=A0ABD5QAY0_9EURY|nr:hypothetical protein [Saliphagus infecundisoli]